MTQQRERRSEAEVQQIQQAQQQQALKKQQQASQPTPTSLPTPTQKPALGATSTSVLPPAPPPSKELCENNFRKFGGKRHSIDREVISA